MERRDQAEAVRLRSLAPFSAEPRGIERAVTAHNGSCVFRFEVRAPELVEESPLRRSRYSLPSTGYRCPHGDFLAFGQGATSQFAGERS